MTPAQFRKLLALARKGPAFEAYIQRKRAKVQQQLEGNTMKDYTELKTLIEKCGVHAQLGPAGQGWGIEQNPHELATFLVRMQELGVRSVLEIGTGYKGGLSRFLAAKMGWQVATIDVQDYQLNYANVQYLRLRSDEAIESLPGHIYLSLKDFQNMYRFDLVFIDGAHDYASVKHDYETYAQCATKAIAFHDIMGLRNCEGAKKFWVEAMALTSETRSGFDFVIAPMPECAGIGWIEL